MADVLLPSDDALLANTALAATVLADAALRATVLPDAALATGVLAATLLAKNSRHGSQRPEDCRPPPQVREYRRRLCQRAIKATSDSEERALWRTQTFDDKVPSTPSALQQVAHRENASAM